MREIETKGREIEIYLKTKETEFNKLETPLQKQKFQEAVQAELKTKEIAFNDFRNKREEEVYRRIYAVAEKIRLVSLPRQGRAFSYHRKLLESTLPTIIYDCKN